MIRSERPRTDPVRRVGRLHEAKRSALGSAVVFRVGQHLQPAAVDVDVAIVGLRRIAEVRRVADAAFEALGLRLDDGDSQRRFVGVRRGRIDRRLHAREIAGCVEAPDEILHLGLVVRRAALHQAVVAHQRRRVLRKPFDLDARRSGTPARCRARPTAWPSARPGRCPRGCERSSRRRRGSRAAWRARAPSTRSTRLPEHLAFGQPPIVAKLDDRRCAERVRVRSSGDVDVDVGDPGRLAWRHRHGYDGRLRVVVHLDLDARGEVALRRPDVADFSLRFLREAIEQLRRHVCVRLPADQSDAALDHRFQRRRRVDHHAIRRLRGCGCGRRWRRVGRLDASGEERRCREDQRVETAERNAQGRCCNRHSNDYRRSPHRGSRRCRGSTKLEHRRWACATSAATAAYPWVPSAEARELLVAAASRDSSSRPEDRRSPTIQSRRASRQRGRSESRSRISEPCKR